MVNIPRRLRRRLITLGTASLLAFTFCSFFLAWDSVIRMAVHFNTHRAYNAVRAALINKDGWLNQPAMYPIDLEHEVGYLIKTGYGTRSRIPGQLEALSSTSGFIGKEGEGFLVVGDWTAIHHGDNEALGVDVYDTIKAFMETKITGKLRGHFRLQKYIGLQKAIESGDEDYAVHIGKAYGWELDALKFIAGLELLYEKIPNKKWYMILDDDTFVIKSSLESFLSHLDPDVPQYIGNAVGDFKGRFAHGGSGVLISGAAMARLFHREDIVMNAYVKSLDETWGDRLVALTLQKLGIYIDEKYNHHFNGEPPKITRISEERFCSPIIGFHGLRDSGDMQSIARITGTGPSATRPVLWGELWHLFSADPIQQLADEPIQKGRDHVGPTDEHTTTFDDVADAEACRAKCIPNSNCLAWTYEDASKKCHMSPWMVIGADDAEHKSSGVSWKKVEKMLHACS